MTDKLAELEMMALQGMSAHAIIRAAWNAAAEQAAKMCEDVISLYVDHSNADTAKPLLNECVGLIRALQVPE